ncbi:hypothetical protein G3I01_13640 [Gramella sp. MT6]|uniref:hypothetical protein n=1 Tax=Gramella sp. MT6 TaxID=2705471 RepID=UPI001C5DFB8B|nr:hypothetical protein [Gramella sp. MT6]QYA26498.1 hypothetical protein G3I01_13640 [Gramella sp. MT6]
MRTRNHTDRKSEIEFLRTARQVNNKVIYIAITIIILVAVVAMTGVYYEYW